MSRKKKTKKTSKTKVHEAEFEVNGKGHFEFEASILAPNRELAEQAVRDVIEKALGKVVMISGEEIECDEPEAQMKSNCAICWKPLEKISNDDHQKFKFNDELTFEENERMGLPYLDGEFACPSHLSGPQSKSSKVRKWVKEISRSGHWNHFFVEQMAHERKIGARK